jgi:SAM-dependent methyltransferase
VSVFDSLRRLLLNPEVRPVLGCRDEAALLAAYERVWSRKRILREVFETRYRLVAADLNAGNVVEIGAGTGNFKRWLAPRRCWTVDILAGRHVDIRADATCLPFRAHSIDNIVVVDALHHFARPFDFLVAAASTLRSGGRLIMVEPYVSLWGYVVNKYLHHEHIDFNLDESSPKGAWEGNAAIPKVMLSPQNRHRLPLRLLKTKFVECLAFPLSGGFSYRAALPSFLLHGLHKLEQTSPFQNRLVSVRVIAVLEK